MERTTTARAGRRPRLRVLVAAILTMLAFVGAAEPASAASVVLKKVGSQTSIWTTTDYTNGSGYKVTVSVIPQFTSHTRTSVKLTTFKVCFSTNYDPRHVYVQISPMITDNGTGWADDWAHRTYYNGDCRTYTVNRTFSNNRTDHMFRIEPRVVDTFLGGSTTAAYER